MSAFLCTLVLLSALFASLSCYDPAKAPPIEPGYPPEPPFSEQRDAGRG